MGENIQSSIHGIDYFKIVKKKDSEVSYIYNFFKAQWVLSYFPITIKTATDNRLEPATKGEVEKEIGIRVLKETFED